MVTAAQGRKQRPEVRYADPADVREMAEGMPQEFLECRDFQHMWRPMGCRYQVKTQTYERSLKCERCDTVKSQVLSRTGAVLGTKYEYADGYTTKGNGRMGSEARDALRLVSVLREYNVETGTKTSRRRKAG